MKKKYQSNLILIFLITILTLYIVNSNLIVKGILDYTKLFITKLFPTSFIIYTISSLLINYQIINLLSHISKTNSSILYVTIMSMISGFPSGTKYTKELYEKDCITNDTGNYLLMYTHFPNPIFMLTATTNIIKNKKIAIILLLSLIISNLSIAIFFYRKKQQTFLTKHNQESFSKALTNAIFSSLKTLILVYGTSLFFYLISLIITNYVMPTPITYILINGIFDLTKGIFSTSLLSSATLKSILIILFTSFGSLSIHIQVKSILANTSLHYKYFLIGRILSTLFALIFFFLFLLLFKIAI